MRDRSAERLRDQFSRVENGHWRYGSCVVEFVLAGQGWRDTYRTTTHQLLSSETSGRWGVLTYTRFLDPLPSGRPTYTFAVWPGRSIVRVFLVLIQPPLILRR